MKKGIIVVIWAICSVVAFGQTDQNEFSIMMVDSTVVGTKQQIYDKIETFLSTKLDNLTLRDKESFKYVGEGHFNFPVKNGFGMTLGNDVIKYRCIVLIKDGKYKITMSDFYHTGGKYEGSRDFNEIGMDAPKGKKIYAAYYKKMRNFCIAEFDKFAIKLDEALTATKAADDF